MLWAYFFAHNLSHLHGVRPLFMRSTPHSVEMQIDRIRRFAFHVFLLPFVAEKHCSSSRRGSASRFFRTPTSTVGGASNSPGISNCANTGNISGKASIEAWLNAKSKVMTNMFGMEVTRLEGLRVYGAFGLMTVGAALSGVSLLVTALCVALAGYNVYKLNVEHPEEKGGEV